MKALKIILGLVSGLVVAFVLVGFMIPELNFTTTVRASRSVDVTFDVFTNVDLMDQWLEGFESIEILSGEPEEIGSKFRVRFNDDGTEIEFTEELKTFEEGKAYGFLMDAGFFTNDTMFSFSEESGETTIRASNSMIGSSWYMRSLLPFMKSDMQRQQVETLQALAALAEKAPPSITGTWTGVDSRGGIQTFTFSRKGKATWRISYGEDTVVSGITYSLSHDSVPFRLDLSGFTDGPLKGKVLYGILSFDDDNTFRFDAEPGSPETDLLRPDDFTASTVTYVRAH